jgi:hypothetical protein
MNHRTAIKQLFQRRCSNALNNQKVRRNIICLMIVVCQNGPLFNSSMHKDNAVTLCTSITGYVCCFIHMTMRYLSIMYSEILLSMNGVIRNVNIPCSDAIVCHEKMCMCFYLGKKTNVVMSSFMNLLKNSLKNNVACFYFARRKTHTVTSLCMNG